MTQLHDKSKIKLRQTALPPQNGISGFFSRVTQATDELWAVVKPGVVRVLGPVARFFQRSITIRGQEWNVIRSDAAIWGTRGDRRVRHGLTWSFIIQALVVLAFTIDWMPRGCKEFLMPAGGGKNAVAVKRLQVVQIKKIKPKKYVINPKSPIIFSVPDIDKMIEIKVTRRLEEGSRHLATVGMTGSGTGDNSGYGAGNKAGEVNLIRLQYSGGDWNSNFGKGADNNMLMEYHLRTEQKTATQTKAIKVIELNDYVKFRAPPLVYITGSGNMDLSEREIVAMRKYMTDKHGMIFADAASPHWGRNFRNYMSRVLPDVRPVTITVDDIIMGKNGLFELSSMPYASPHDPPMVLTGWKINGRWVAIYHPGDIGDCWKDGHSGVSADTAQAAYDLGTNIIHYAFSQYSEWVQNTAPGGKQ